MMLCVMWKAGEMVDDEANNEVKEVNKNKTYVISFHFAGGVHHNRLMISLLLSQSLASEKCCY